MQIALTREGTALRYSVFVSYIEIYNDQMFDLLEDSLPGPHSLAPFLPMVSPPYSSSLLLPVIIYISFLSRSPILGIIIHAVHHLPPHGRIQAGRKSPKENARGQWTHVCERRHRNGGAQHGRGVCAAGTWTACSSGRTDHLQPGVEQEPQRVYHPGTLSFPFYPEGCWRDVECKVVEEGC